MQPLPGILSELATGCPVAHEAHSELLPIHALACALIGGRCLEAYNEQRDTLTSEDAS